MPGGAMATVCKLYRDSPQIIQPTTWTLLTFERTLRNDRTMAKALSLIVPKLDGDFIWSRNVRWEPIEIADGDLRPRQFMSRFVRAPATAPDDTGSADHLDSPGRDWDTVTWPFEGNAGQPVGVQVWHDHDQPAAVGHAQFTAATWDY